MSLSSLTSDEALRYSRHLLLPGVGLDGQRRLKSARVLLVGAGGLGSPAAMYLAAAGIGHLCVVDFDVVDVTNLQRQILHGTSDVGRSKLDSARDAIAEINPHVKVDTVEARLDSANALEIIREYDIVVDGSDNFPTRYLTNDACVILGKPNVYGSVFRFEGQASVFATASGPCYRCLFREPPPPGLVPSCAEAGVLGVLPGLVGVIQATEAIKVLLGLGESLVGRLLLVDALRMQFRTLQLERDPACPACGTRTIRELIDYDEFCGLRTTAGVREGTAIPEYSPRDLASALASGAPIDLLDVREPYEWQIAHIDGARLVPLGSLENALTSLSADREIIVYCKGGARGIQAARTLRAAGFTHVSNLAGGISRWSEDVDQTLTKY